jgi:hypothetical protein
MFFVTPSNHQQIFFKRNNVIVDTIEITERTQLLFAWETDTQELEFKGKEYFIKKGTLYQSALILDYFCNGHRTLPFVDGDILQEFLRKRVKNGRVRYQLHQFLHPYSIQKSRKRPRGVLLYGPPGTGKSVLGVDLLMALGIKFTNKNMALASSRFLSSYVGETDTKIMAEADSILEYPMLLHAMFLDEVETIAGNRNSDTNSDHKRDSTNTLLTQIEDTMGTKPNILFVGCTNSKVSLDDAIIRAGRMEIHVSHTTELSR